MTPGRTTVQVILVFFTLFAVGLFLVSPARAWWSQRDEISDLEAELGDGLDLIETHEVRVEDLQTDEEIEKLAREQYGLVRPGDESYVVLPPPAD